MKEEEENNGESCLETDSSWIISEIVYSVFNHNPLPLPSLFPLPLLLNPFPSSVQVSLLFGTHWVQLELVAAAWRKLFSRAWAANLVSGYITEEKRFTSLQPSIDCQYHWERGGASLTLSLCTVKCWWNQYPISLVQMTTSLRVDRCYGHCMVSCPEDSRPPILWLWRSFHPLFLIPVALERVTQMSCLSLTTQTFSAFLPVEYIYHHSV